MASTNSEVYIASLPAPHVVEANFAIRTCELPSPLEDGQLIVRMRFISLDPYMRMKMSAPASWAVGTGCEGACVAEIVEPKSSDFAVGEFVKKFMPWRILNAVDASQVKRLDPKVPPEKYLSCCGGPGLSGFLPLKHLPSPISISTPWIQKQGGTTAFVSSAASGVGQVAAQLLKLRGGDGLTVVGSCGSEEKVAHLSSLGIPCMNYKKEAPDVGIKRLCPNGVDFFFDNVGGAFSDAMLAHMNPQGQITRCGGISEYDGNPYEPNNLELIDTKQISKQGYWVGQWEKEWPETTVELAELWKAGKLDSRDTIVEGLENLPRAFVGVFRGENVGKMLIKL